MWTTSIYQTLPILGIWSIQKTLSSRRSKWKARNSHSSIERFLQQQITAQTNARSPILADRSHVTDASIISERDVERRQHQEEINLLTEKLRDKEAECKNLKAQEINLFAEKLGDKEAECKALKTQNPVSRDLAVAKDCVERLRETVARQNEVIFSLKRNRSYLAVFDPPSYEEEAAFSSSVS
jgi:dynactin complex subunit